MDTIKINSKQVKIIAHRGLSGLERENTCPAFVAAGNRSYFGIETDVHVTKDKEFVIIHDETTDRVSMQQSNINVEKNDYSAVKDIVLPDLSGSTCRQDIRIPLLTEYIKICQKYDKVCVLEVKNHFLREDLQKMIDAIIELGYINKVMFISFDLENCVNIREILTDNEVQWLIGNKRITDSIIKTLNENRLDLDIYYKVLSKEIVKKLHDKGIKVNCWTCDNKKEAENLIEMGIDYLTSNILE